MQSYDYSWIYYFISYFYYTDYNAPSNKRRERVEGNGYLLNTHYIPVIEQGSFIFVSHLFIEKIFYSHPGFVIEESSYLKNMKSFFSASPFTSLWAKKEPTHCYPGGVWAILGLWLSNLRVLYTVTVLLAH